MSKYKGKHGGKKGQKIRAWVDPPPPTFGQCPKENVFFLLMSSLKIGEDIWRPEVGKSLAASHSAMNSFSTMQLLSCCNYICLHAMPLLGRFLNSNCHKCPTSSWLPEGSGLAASAVSTWNPNLTLVSLQRKYLLVFVRQPRFTDTVKGQ